MLTKENNELLTRVCGDAPMGKFMRSFWVPAIRSAALKPGGDPMHVRLFGEDYVAFRGESGQVGFFDEYCPHRRASLLTARNEDDSLVCLFHGWKFHVSGKTIDVPTEPEDRREHFCKKVPVKHFPVREAGGLVWVWLGEGEPAPFPEFEFNKLPESHVMVKVAKIKCNWLQVLETTVDSAHVSQLHQTWTRKVSATVSKTQFDTAPQYEIDPQPYGLRAGAIRKLPNGNQYVRISEFVQPWYSFIPKAPHENHVVAYAVPIDDENTAHGFIFYNTERPLTYEDKAIAERQFGIDPNNSDDNFYEYPVRTKENRWLQDRSKLDETFTGLYGVLVEDFVIVESMGPIADRTKEYLGSSDKFITSVRQHLLKAMRSIQAGETPVGLNGEVDYGSIRATNGELPPGEDWRNVPKY